MHGTNGSSDDPLFTIQAPTWLWENVRLHFDRWYMANKPGKYGIKIWAARDALSAYAWNIKVYTGKPTGEDNRKKKTELLYEANKTPKRSFFQILRGWDFLFYFSFFFVFLIGVPDTYSWVIIFVTRTKDISKFEVNRRVIQYVCD